MATNPTTHRAYGKPTDQGSSDVWGVELNALFDAVDTDVNKVLTTAGYAEAGGTADVITATPDPAFTAYTPGIVLRVKIAADNTTAPTINVNGLGAKAIKGRDGSTLTAGALKAGDIVLLAYNGTVFLLLSTVAATAAEALAGTDAFKALTAAAFAGNKALTANGYYKLPGGFIVQWGTYSSAITSEASVPITFPVAFPTAAFGIWATTRNTSGTTFGNTVMQEVSLSTSGATLKANGFDSAPPDAGGGFRWLALGH